MFDQNKASGRRIGGKTTLGRMGAFAEVEIEGKKVDLGIYLASKGLALLDPESEFLIYETLPSGRSRADYVKAFREAEKYAEKHRFGMFKYGTRKEVMEENEEIRKFYMPTPGL